MHKIIHWKSSKSPCDEAITILKVEPLYGAWYSGIYGKVFFF